MASMDPMCVSPPASAKPQWRWLLPVACAVALLLLAVTLLAGIQVRHMEACDDAFISFRMARNLADGHGLRFNAGGPTVEAASNFLLTVALAGARLMGLDLIQASLGLALICGVLTLLLLARELSCHCGVWSLWAPAALATMTIFHRNLVNGLETSLTGLLLLAAVALYLRARGGAGAQTAPRPAVDWTLLASSALLAAVSMTRPEGPMYMVALGLPRLLDLWRRWRAGGNLRLRTEAAWAGGFLLLYLPYFCWRLYYFGALLPNTYHAKEMSFSSGMHKFQLGAIYLEVVLLMEPLVLLVLLAGLWLLVVAPSRRVRTLVVVVTAQLLFVVLCGGDWPHMFGYARFLCPVLPLALWLLAEAGACLAAPARYAPHTDEPAQVGRRRPRVLVLAALAALLALQSQVNLVRLRGLRLPPHFHLLNKRAPLTRQAVARAYLQNLPRISLARWLRQATSSYRLSRYDWTFDAAAGLWLRDRYGVNTRMASIQAGQFAYWAEMPMFDLFGLATPGVAPLQNDAQGLYRALAAFDPAIVAFYRWGNDLHHRQLVREGSLWRAGYGLRYVLQSGNHRAFLIFEKGYKTALDPVKMLNTSLPNLPHRLDPDRWIAIINERQPYLFP